MAYKDVGDLYNKLKGTSKPSLYDRLKSTPTPSAEKYMPVKAVTPTPQPKPTAPLGNVADFRKLDEKLSTEQRTNYPQKEIASQIPGYGKISDNAYIKAQALTPRDNAVKYETVVTKQPRGFVEFQQQEAKAKQLKEQQKLKEVMENPKKNPEAYFQYAAQDFENKRAYLDSIQNPKEKSLGESVKYLYEAPIKGIVKMPSQMLNYVSQASSLADPYVNVAYTIGKNMAGEIVSKSGKQVFPADIAINAYNKAIVNPIDKIANDEQVHETFKFVGDTLSSIPQTALNFVPYVGPILFSLSAAGGYLEQAEQGGADVEQRIIFATLAGATESLTEHLWGITSSIKANFAGQNVSFGKSLLKEGIEETLTEPIVGFYEKFIYNPNKKILYGTDGKFLGREAIFDAKAMGDAFLSGALMSLIMSAGAMPIKYASKKMADAQVKSGKRMTIEKAIELSEQYIADLEKYGKDNGIDMAEYIKMSSNEVRGYKIDKQISDKQEALNKFEKGTAEYKKAEKELNDLKFSKERYNETMVKIFETIAENVESQKQNTTETEMTNEVPNEVKIDSEQEATATVAPESTETNQVDVDVSTKESPITVESEQSQAVTGGLTKALHDIDNIDERNWVNSYADANGVRINFYKDGDKWGVRSEFPETGRTFGVNEHFDTFEEAKRHAGGVAVDASYFTGGQTPWEKHFGFAPGEQTRPQNINGGDINSITTENPTAESPATVEPTQAQNITEVAPAKEEVAEKTYSEEAIPAKEEEQPKAEPNEYDKKVKEYEQRADNHNKQTNEYRQLAELGMSVTGVRLADAETTGKYYEALQKGDVSQQDWDNYIDDLIVSKKIRDKSILGEARIQQAFYRKAESYKPKEKVEEVVEVEEVDLNEQLIDNVPNSFIYKQQQEEIRVLKKEIKGLQAKADENYDKHGDYGHYGDKLDKARERFKKLSFDIQKKYLIKIDNRKINEDVKNKVSKMDDTDLKYLTLDELKEPLYPKNYFIFKKKNANENIYIEVKGTPVKNDLGLDLFIHKSENKWIVSEAKTGLMVFSEAKKQETINKAIEQLSKIGVESLNKLIQSNIERYGPTPRYIGIEKSKLEIRPITDTEVTKQNETNVTEQTPKTEKENAPEQVYRYYLTQRPPSIGTQPTGTINVVSFDSRQNTGNIKAWGYVEYNRPLTTEEMRSYELVEETKTATTNAVKETKEAKQAEPQKDKGVEDTQKTSETNTEEVQGFAGSNAVKEAINERDGRTETDGENQSVLDKALQSLKQDGIENITATVTTAKTLEQRQIEKLLNELGIKVIFFDSDIPLLNGLHNPSVPDTVFIRSQDARKMTWAVGHEFFHTLKTNHADIYKAVMEIYRDSITTEQKQKYLEKFDSNPSYQSRLLSNEDLIIEEMLADEAGNVFTNQNFWERLYLKGKDLFEKAIEVVRNLFAKLTKLEYDNFLIREQIDRFSTDFDTIINTVRERAERGEIVKGEATETSQSMREMSERTPSTEEANLALTGKQEVSKFLDNSLKKSKFIPEPMKALLDELDFLYGKESNEGQINAATEAIKKDMAGVIEKIENAETLESGQMAVEALLIHKYYIDEAARTGDNSKAIAWAKTIRPKITKNAQALQAVSMWKRFTTESVLIQAERTIDELRTPKEKQEIEDTTDDIKKKFREVEKDTSTDIAKDVEDNAEGIIRKARAKKILVTETEINGVTQEDIDKQNPADLLVAKIENALKDKTASESDFITDMVNELFNVAKESPLPLNVSSDDTAITFIAEAISNREQYKEVWLEAKEILKEKYKDSEMMDTLSDYFEKGIKPTFSVKTLDKAIGKYIVGLQKAKALSLESKAKLGDVVRNYYATGKGKIQEMIDGMVKESGLTGDEAKLLVKYIQNRMHTLTKAKKESILASMFKESVPTKSNPYKIIEELSNLGAFKNTKYQVQARIKLKESLYRIIKESGIDIGKLVRSSVDVRGFNKLQLQKKLSEEIQVNDSDLRQIVELVGDTFDDILKDKGKSILDNMAKERKKAEHASFYDKIVELYNLGAFKNEYAELIAKKMGLPSLSDESINNIIYLTGELNKIENKGLDNILMRDVLQNRIASEIINLVPASMAKKIASIQVIQQLLNFITISRNILGNGFAYRAERLNKYLASFIDMSRSKLTGKDRTITFRTGMKFFEPTKRFVKDFILAADASIKGYNLYGVTNNAGKYLTTSSKSFESDWNPFKHLETVLSISLRGPDYAAYMRGLINKANEIAYVAGINQGLKGEALEKFKNEYLDTLSEEAFEQARKYGEKITFQNPDNYIGKTFSMGKAVLNRVGIGKTVTKGGIKTKEFGLGNVIMNYAQTPGNILANAFEFSPAGFIKSAYHVAEGIAAKKKGVEYDNAKSIEAFSRAIIGTFGFSLMGYVLSSLGIITGEDDKDQEMNELMRTMGLGKYKLNVTALVRWFTSGFKKEAAQKQEGDFLISYDWAQPLSMSISLGVNAQQNKAKNKGDLSGVATTIVGSFEGMLDTITETSLLQGLTRAVRGYDAKQNIETTAQNLITGFTGTFNNQLRKITDKYQRTTKSDDIIEETLNLIANRLPFASRTLPVKINTLGEEQLLYQEGQNNIFNVFFNPAFTSRYKPTPGLKMVLELYEQTGNTTIAPRKAPTSVTYNKKTVKLTAEEINELQKMMGKSVKDNLERLVRDKAFMDSSEQTKIDRIFSMLNSVGTKTRNELIKKMRAAGRFDEGKK